MLSNRERVLLAILAILVGTATAYVYTGRPSADPTPGSSAGALDDNFGQTPGRLTTDFNHVDNHAAAVVVQPDGKFIVVGETDSVSSLPDSTDFAIARYLADGSLDTEFGDVEIETIDPYDRTGQTTTTFGESEDVPTTVVLQDDGKIIVGGRTSDMFDETANSDFALVRYTADGRLDVTFGEDGRVVTSFGKSASVIRLAIDSQGRIVAAGGVGEDFWQGDFALARYLADGRPDLNFGDGYSEPTGKVRVGYGTNFEELRGLALDSDDNIYAAGASWDQNGDTGADLLIRKFSASGSYFAGFGSLGRVTYHLGVDDAVHNLVIQEVDGVQKLLAVGINDGNFLLARFELDGSFDTSFGMLEDYGLQYQLGYVVSDFGEYESAQAVGILADGSLIIAGGYYSGVNEDTGTLEYDLIVAKYTADGDLEDAGASMFGESGRVTHPKIFTSDLQGLAVQADDLVLMVGTAYLNDTLEDFATVRVFGTDSFTTQTTEIPHRATVLPAESSPADGALISSTLIPIVTLQLDSDPVPENFDNVLLYRYDEDYVMHGSACLTSTRSQLVSIDVSYNSATKVLSVVPAADLDDGYCYNLLITDVGFPDRSIDFYSTDFIVKLTDEAANQYYSGGTTSPTPSASAVQAQATPSPSVTTTTSSAPQTTAASSSSPTSSATSSKSLASSTTPLPTISGSTTATSTPSAPSATPTASTAKPVATAGTTLTPSPSASSPAASSPASSTTSPATSATPFATATPQSAPSTQSVLPVPTTTPTPTQTAASGQSISLTYAVADGHTYLPTEAIEIPVDQSGDRLELAGSTQPSQPNTVITVYVLSTEQKYTTTTDSQGKWSLSFPTEDLEVGNHHVDLETKTNTRHTVLNFAVVPVTSYATGALPPTDSAQAGGTDRTLILLGSILALLVIFLIVFRVLHSREMIHPQK